jgi:hypothetical protein
VNETDNGKHYSLLKSFMVWVDLDN